MKRRIMIGLMLFGAFYVHSRLTFSEARVMGWLLNHTSRAMSGDTTACDDYTDDVEVVLTAEGRRGRWEVEGGKNELCGYLRQAAAAFTVLQASTNTRFDDVRIERGPFPWMRARVTYTQVTSVSAGGIPPLEIESRDVLELQRGLTGLKIRSVESASTGGL